MFSLLQLVRFRDVRKTTLFYARGYVPLFMMALGHFNYVAEVHDYRSPRPRRIINFIISRARAVVMNSVGTKDAMQAHYHIPIGTSIVAPNGIDMDYFNVGETTEEARRKLSLPLPKTLIGYVGRLETVGQGKGISELMSAFKAVAQNDTSLVLYIIGGPEHIARECRMSVGDAPIVFTGQVPYREVPLYLRSMDILVLPLPSGRHAQTTSPIKLFEYMAAGKPIVASDLPSVRVHLNEENAFLYRADDIGDMSRVLQEVVATPSGAQDKAKVAQQNASAYSWEQRARNIISFIS